MLDGWIVIFTGPKLIDELRKSPDDELSSVEGTAEVRLPFPPTLLRLPIARLRPKPTRHTRSSS